MEKRCEQAEQKRSIGLGSFILVFAFIMLLAAGFIWAIADHSKTGNDAEAVKTVINTEADLIAKLHQELAAADTLQKVYAVSQELDESRYSGRGYPAADGRGIYLPYEAEEKFKPELQARWQQLIGPALQRAKTAGEAMETLSSSRSIGFLSAEDKRLVIERVATLATQAKDLHDILRWGVSDYLRYGEDQALQEAWRRLSGQEIAAANTVEALKRALENTPPNSIEERMGQAKLNVLIKAQLAKPSSFDELRAILADYPVGTDNLPIRLDCLRAMNKLAKTSAEVAAVDGAVKVTLENKNREASADWKALEAEVAAKSDQLINLELSQAGTVEELKSLWRYCRRDSAAEQAVLAKLEKEYAKKVERAASSQRQPTVPGS